MRNSLRIPTDSLKPPFSAAAKTENNAAVITVARQHCLRLFGTIEETLNQVLQCPGDDSLHDLRVSLRRFHAALRFFGPILPMEVHSLSLALRQTIQATGPFRDVQVWHAFLRNRARRKLGKNLWQKTEEVLSVQKEQTQKDVQELLSRSEHRGILQKIADFITSVSDLEVRQEEKPLWVPFAARRLRRQVRRLYAHRALAYKATGKSVHALRKRIRRVRYYEEFCGDIDSDPRKRLYGLLKELSDILGEWHDLTEQEHRLAGWRKPLAKILKTEIGRQRSKCRRNYRLYWDAFQKRDFQKGLLRELKEIGSEDSDYH